MYKIYGALGSPYSMKMRALMRYRRIPHIWVHGAHGHGMVLSKVKAPVIPVVEYPDGSFQNDSTQLIYDLEARHPERSAVPPDGARAFLAHLLEDFADEWLVKAMFGYRWLREVDQVQMSRWLAFDAMKGGGTKIDEFAEQFRARQVGRTAIVGCTEANRPLIEASTRAVLTALEAHVAGQHCLFGTRPSLAEFSMFGQVSQLGVDPTAQAMMRAEFPYAYRWLLHIDDMSGVEGEWEAAGTPLSVVIAELLKVVGDVYFPFLLANAAALAAGAQMFTFEAMGHRYSQATFKYQGKCLAELRARYAALDRTQRQVVDPLLEASDCIGALGAA